MKIGITSDHRGYKLKEYLKKQLKYRFDIVDLGPTSKDNVDFPKYAFDLCEKVNKKEIEFGIAICGTGIGMSIACNKQKGIYCAKINNVKEAKLAKEHNDANVIAISGNTYLFKAKRMIIKFLKTEFNSEDETYQKRINDIKELEEVE